MNLQDAVLALRQAGIPSPRLDAELLLAHVLRQHRAELYARADIPLSDGCSKHFAMLARRRVAGEPLAYLVGYKEFYGHRFVVNPHVLVPRPETELLVEQALRVLPQDAPGTVIDVCAGSGCVGISIALARPLARVWATDLSEEALKVARRNAANLGVSARIEFVQGDLLEPLTHAGGSGADSRENFLHLDVPTPFVVPAKGCFQVEAGTWGPRKVFARSAKLCGAKAKAGPADPRSKHGFSPVPGTVSAPQRLTAVAVPSTALLGVRSPHLWTAHASVPPRSACPRAGAGIQTWDSSVGVDCIVANPPYVRPEEYACLEPGVRLHEPVLALLGEGKDGLGHHRRIARQAGSLLRRSGLVLLEISPMQARAALSLTGVGLSLPRLLKDLAGHARVVALRQG